MVELEERVLHARSNELRAEKEASQQAQTARRAQSAAQSALLDRGSLQSIIDTLQVTPASLQQLQGGAFLFAVLSLWPKVARGRWTGLIYLTTSNSLSYFAHSLMHMLNQRSSNNSPVEAEALADVHTCLNGCFHWPVKVPWHIAFLCRGSLSRVLPVSCASGDFCSGWCQHGVVMFVRLTQSKMAEVSCWCAAGGEAQSAREAEEGSARRAPESRAAPQGCLHTDHRCGRSLPGQSCRRRRRGHPQTARLSARGRLCPGVCAAAAGAAL